MNLDVQSLRDWVDRYRVCPQTANPLRVFLSEVRYLKSLQDFLVAERLRGLGSEGGNNLK